MSFRRYIATTVREGLDRVRRELGEDALILSNKRLGPGRIEIVAAASDSMQALVEQADRPNGATRHGAAARERARPGDPAQTESFEDFVRRQAPASAPRATAGTAGPAPRATAGTPATTPGAMAGSPAEARSAKADQLAEARSAKPGQPVAATRPRSDRRDAPAVARSTKPGQPAAAPGAAASGAEAGVAMYREVARTNVESYATSDGRSEPAPAVFRQRAERDAVTPSVATIAGMASPGSLNGSIVRPASPEAMDDSAIRPAAPPAPPAAPEAAATLKPAPTPKPLPASASAQTDVERDDARVMAELRSLRTVLSDRIAALESNIALSRPPGAIEAGAQRNPVSTRVMTRLLMSGFSPDLARRVAAHAPATSDITATDAWLHEVVAGNLRCAAAADGLLESQGAIALVGPTGVGKTTTVAKLAARFAVRYGATQLGLITLDSYRIGAHEQLRSYGRILGVPMHIAQDGATLRELLTSLQGKRLVLVDTCGLSQRDERMEEMLGTLSAARFNMQPLRRVLLLNAASHSETLDEVARAWHAPDAAGAIMTKMDEAARIGGPVDCLLRHRMMLFGLTNGQRVPEDWHPASARLIAHIALKPSTSPFALGDEEARAWSEQPQGSLHA